MRPGVTIIVVTGVLSLCGGCTVHPRDPMPMDPAQAEKLANPFAPASMQIHGLTRSERDAKGVAWIICHVELKDAWGDTTKTTGQMRVQLFRPDAGSGPGTEALKWDINLTDLKLNVSLYDAATRTYRLPLQGAPDWVLGESSPARAGKPRFVLHATLNTRGPAGEARILRAEYIATD